MHSKTSKLGASDLAFIKDRVSWHMWSWPVEYELIRTLREIRALPER